MYSDLPEVKKDRYTFDKLVSRHGFERNQIKILMEPKLKECIAIFSDLNRLFKGEPEETILTLSCYASHGMIQDGRQVILVNEYASDKGFYKIVGVEENTRMLAMKYSNAYLIVIYACCREILILAQHSGGISLKQFKELELA